MHWHRSGRYGLVAWRFVDPDENGNGGGWQRLWYCVEFEKEEDGTWAEWSGWWYDTEVLGGVAGGLFE